MIDYMSAMELCRVSQEQGVAGEFVHLMTSGHPGVGKNHLWQKFADKINYKLTTMRENKEMCEEVRMEFVYEKGDEKVIKFKNKLQ